MPRDPRALARGELAMLALLAERPAHGWALSRDVAPGSEIGEIWSGDRQRVYRGLRKLNALGLIESALTTPGGGAHRTVYRVTPAGKDTLDRWLREPVEHMRDAQSTFVLKLVFTQRAGLDPVPLLNAQRATVLATIEAISHRLRTRGSERRVHLHLRLETARALLTFIDGLSNRAASRPRTPASVVGRRSRPAAAHPHPPGTRVSDFSGAELHDESETATIILRFGDTSRGIHVASAHVDDPVVTEIADVAQKTGTVSQSSRA
jgi:PadR family transcriptional regulator AphA